MIKPLVSIDTECYRDYWMCSVKRFDTGARRVFEQYEGHPLDRAGLDATLSRCTLVSFNGAVYDIPMIAFALRGASNSDLKRCSDLIIQANMRPWDVERQFNCKMPQYDHIDLIEVVPGMVSLKVYMGRLHCRKLQDLPIEHDASIDPIQRPIIVDYNDNDLEGNIALYRKFEEKIKLREQMSAIYGVDLRSKSDAQIAEAVIKAKLTQLTGVVPKRPSIGARSFKFRFPNFLRHSGPIVQGVIQIVAAADFIVEGSGKVSMPKQLSDAKIKIGQGVYRMGIGGLHSSEQKQAIVADDETEICDNDVASYYPRIIDKTGLYPKHLGTEFLTLYRGLIEQRITAKKAGDKITAETLKIVLNGSFGKFGNAWSILYSPDLMIQTTVTGQLSLLMLIEWLEASGIARVASANTDGIVIVNKKAHRQIVRDIIKRWEDATGFETEETRYAAIFSRDVNNYIALKEGGGVKLKGAYAEPEPVASSWPSPHNQICVSAVCAFLEDGWPIEGTIWLCNDVRQFLEVRNVTGGGMWRGKYLGRAVRWYHSVDGAPIHYAKKILKEGGHQKVPDSDGSRPLMELTGEFPADLDRAWYAREAYRILDDIGYSRMAAQGK